MSGAFWKVKEWEALCRDELYAVLAARQHVFVVEQTCAYLDADGNDVRALHLWARDRSNAVLAYARIFGPSGSHGSARVGRVLTTQAGRGRGLGLELMHRALSVVRERFGPVAVDISAQKYLVAFYQKFGFDECSDDYLEDGIVHVAMRRPANSWRTPLEESDRL